MSSQRLRNSKVSPLRGPVAAFNRPASNRLGLLPPCQAPAAVQDPDAVAHAPGPGRFLGPAGAPDLAAGGRGLGPVGSSCATGQKIRRCQGRGVGGRRTLQTALVVPLGRTVAW